MAIGCVVHAAPTAGVTITGSRSTSARIISKDRLPEPMTIEARNSIDGHARLAQDLADLVPAAQVRRQAPRVRPGPQVDDPPHAGVACGRGGEVPRPRALLRLEVAPEPIECTR